MMEFRIGTPRIMYRRSHPVSCLITNMAPFASFISHPRPRVRLLAEMRSNHEMRSDPAKKCVGMR